MGSPPRSPDERPTASSTFAAPIGAAAAFTVAGLLTTVRDTWFGSTNAALILVVVVAAAASIGGRGAGAVTAFVAALSYNFFLTRPYLSLHIDDATDATTVVLLLVVGLVVGEFARDRGRTLTKLWRETQGTERLERMAALLVSERNHDELCSAVADELREQLVLRAVTWHPVGEPTGLPVMERTGWIATDHHRYGRDGYLLPEAGIELPVEFAGARLGAFALVPHPDVGISADERRVAVALADLLASALARGSGRWQTR